MKGFWISTIIAKGEGKMPASISLKKGVNIVTGPSDTGKSYLFSVINYVLGRSIQPDRDIPEGNGYDTFLLEIVAFESGLKYSIERKFDENKVTVTDSISSKVYFTNRALSDENHLSNFLLDLCGLKNTFLLKNKARGDKQLLSFKNVLQFTSIAEDRIITKSSPFYFTDIPSNHILEQSAISSILEGVDFSEVRTIEDPKKRETKISGKLEFIDKQIVSLSKLRELEINSLSGLQKDSFFLDKFIVADNLANLISRAKGLEAEIDLYYDRVNALVEKKIYHQELIRRFEILERQYLSDLDRLDFILEAEELTSQLPSVLCPICASPISEDGRIHIEEISDFRNSVKSEVKLIKEKLLDLSESISYSISNINLIESDRINNDSSLRKLQEELQIVKPQILNFEEILANHLKYEKLVNKVDFLDFEIQELYVTKDELNKVKSQVDSTDITSVCDYEMLEKLAKFIQERLVKWDYSEKPKVIFNSEFRVFDIVISGKGRGGYGKGRRAISYTACLLGFLDYCYVENRNFSYMVVLDSPLTTFKDKDNDIEELEEFAGLEDLFFENLSQASENMQLIIFENKIPKDRDSLHLIEFTRDKSIGRYGFYPV